MTNDEVKFADVAKECIECFDVMVDELKNKQFIVIFINAKDKV